MGVRHESSSGRALSRRIFVASVFIGLDGLRRHARAGGDPARTLDTYLDTLIPADESPSATQLGVREQILAKAARDPTYRELVHRGCAWLDGEARSLGAQTFSSLDTTSRERIMTRAADGTGGALAAHFFVRTRMDAFFHYYAHPATWRSLAYPGPPQPRGFRDHARPPRRTPDG